jgi:uncharacterized repeat protein (TIGR02543 family)
MHFLYEDVTGGTFTEGKTTRMVSSSISNSRYYVQETGFTITEFRNIAPSVTGWTAGTASTHGGADSMQFNTAPGTEGEMHLMRNSYTLRYSVLSSSSAPVTMKYEQPVDLSYIPAVPAGYEFAGWYTSPAYFELLAPLDAINMPASSLTLFAKIKPFSVTATFDVNGGAPQPDPQTVHAGETLVEPPAPTRPGYVFRGWFLTDDPLTPWVFDRAVYQDQTLLAHWSYNGVSEYTVRHVLLAGNQLIYEQSSFGGIVETVYVRALQTQDPGYPADTYLKPDYTTKPVTIVTDPGSNVVTFYYDEFSIRGYTVRYLETGTNAVLRAEDSETSVNAILTLLPPAITGYTASVTHIVADLTLAGDHIYTFYYTLDEAIVEIYKNPDNYNLAGFGIMRGHYAGNFTGEYKFLLRVDGTTDVAKVQSILADLTLTAASSQGFESVYPVYTQIMDASLTLTAANIGDVITVDGVDYREINFYVTDVHKSGIVDFTLTHVGGSSAKYRLLVPGDVNKDGNINSTDLARVFNIVKNPLTATPARGEAGGYQFELANTIPDNNINTTDYTNMFSIVKGTLSIG